MLALGPATASATHFTNSTKECSEPGVCVLTIEVDGVIFHYDFPNETIFVD